VKELVLMDSKCPGQDMRKLRVELFKCSNCGAEVEIFFSDETRVKCQKCGTMVFREQCLPASPGARRHGNASVKNAGSN